MGRANTQGMIETGGINDDAILDWHLTCNHYPPIRGGVGFARLAIAAVNEGRGNAPLDDGTRRADNAWEVIEAWHLEDFLDHEGGED